MCVGVGVVVVLGVVVMWRTSSFFSCIAPPSPEPSTFPINVRLFSDVCVCRTVFAAVTPF
jgi:hypothetical protein